jgi:hypothetical protein
MDDQLSSYIFLRNNVYYFSRRVPLDMKDDSGVRLHPTHLSRLSIFILVKSNSFTFHLLNSEGNGKLNGVLHPLFESEGK